MKNIVNSIKERIKYLKGNNKSQAETPEVQEDSEAVIKDYDALYGGQPPKIIIRDFDDYVHNTDSTDSLAGIV